jgi:hypothetical protein
MMIKECPACKRTYSDKSITFCLADGALLSAPFDPEGTQHLPAARDTGPPPREMIYAVSDSNAVPPRQREVVQAIDVPPTIASPIPQNVRIQEHGQTPPVDKKPNRLRHYLILTVILLMIVPTYIGVRWFQRRMIVRSIAAAAKAYNEAIKNKDVEGFKRVASEENLMYRAQAASAFNKSLDEYLKEYFENNASYGDVQEMVYEEFWSGDQVMAQIKSNNIPHYWIFNKENGIWKVRERN